MEYNCSKCGNNKSPEDFTKYYRERAERGVKSLCNKCDQARKKNWARTPAGRSRRLYKRMFYNSAHRGHRLPAFSYKTFFKWVLKNGLKELMKQWKDNNYDKEYTPSIDRIYNNKGYILDNMQLCTWGFNNRKQERDGILFNDEIPF